MDESSCRVLQFVAFARSDLSSAFDHCCHDYDLLGSAFASTPEAFACCRYIIPGGSAGVFTREGYKFDVGSSMMFGMGQQGTTNLITRALQAAGKELETIPDPTQIHYHLPKSAAHPEVLFLCCCMSCHVCTRPLAPHCNGILHFHTCIALNDHNRNGCMGLLLSEHAKPLYQPAVL